jgi:hypothetical protein
MKRTIISLVMLVAIAAQLHSQETPPPYAVLATGDHFHGQTNIDVPSGYLVEIISLDLVTGIDQPGTPGQFDSFSRLEIQRHDSPFDFDIRYTSENIPDALPKFTGPAQLQIFDEGGRNSRAVVGLKIIEISTSTVIPVNTVVIPSDASGPVEIILESSEDLVTWTPVNPGSYGASTERRFFRVRAVTTE